MRFQILLSILIVMIPGINGNKLFALQGDTILFSGYQWITKESNGRHTGPGNNYFSGGRENVYVDNDGKLHLRVTNRNDKWYCPELKLIDKMGYGTYSFYLEQLPQPLDKDVVIGLFLYNHEDTTNFHKELDIEISTWGKDSSLNTQFVVQPHESKAHRFQTDLSKCSVHMIEIKPNKITFKSCYPGGEMGNDPVLISKQTVKPDYDYRVDNEYVSMNVWLYKSIETASLKEFEVVISKFEFTRKSIKNLFK